MVVAALEAMAMIAKQYPARSQSRRTLGRAILEAALHNGGKADRRMLFLERPVARTGGAHDVVDQPTFPGCDGIDANVHATIIAIFPKHRNGRMPTVRPRFDD